MATMTIRDVPDNLYEQLKEKARQERRSLNAQVIEILDRALQGDDLQRQRLETLDRIEARVRQLPPRKSETPDSTDLLREDRDR